MKKRLPAAAFLLTVLVFAHATALLAEGPVPEVVGGKSISMEQLGAEAHKKYIGDGIGITPTATGARLRTVMQDLEADATAQGLWLKSVSDEDVGKDVRFRVLAADIGREGNAGALIRLPVTGKVNATSQGVAFIRPGLVEEYTVSTDGVRQDFVVLERPLGAGDLSVQLSVDGARAVAAGYGAKLILNGNGREIAYSRLRVTDAMGRELTARIAVPTAEWLQVIVDDSAATYPVRIDPTFSDADWTSIEANQGVWSLAVDGSGNLYAAGGFSTIGGVSANYVAKWNGNTWSALGSGMNSDRVYALAVIGSDLYAGGYFTKAGGITVNYIARWNGSAWSALGSGLNGEVDALAVSGSNLYVGGTFTEAGGITANYIAKWDGSVWSALGSGMDNWVDALAVSGDHVYAAGKFTEAGGTAANYVAKWNGSAWSALGSGMDYRVNALAMLGNDLFAGGRFDTAGGTPASRIAMWNGSVWSAVGGGMTGVGVSEFAVKGDVLYAAGNFYKAGGANANSVASWNGSTWSAVGSGLGGIVGALTVLGDDLFAGGEFLTPGATSSQYLARIKLGGGSGINPPTVTSISPTSGPAAGGTSVTITGTNFTGATGVTIGGTTATGIIVVNATTITATTPAGTAGAKSVVVNTPGGSNSANSLFTYVAAPTVTLSTANLLSTATTLTLTGTNFSSTPGNNTVVFTPTGTGTVTAATATSLTVTSLSGLTLGALSAVVTTNGLSSGAAVQVANVLVARPGDLDSLNLNIVGNYVGPTAVQPDGKTIIGGSFTSVLGQPRNNIARLNADGTLDAGFNPNVNYQVVSLAVQANGQILLGGSFTTVGGTTRRRLARLNADGTLDAGFNPNPDGQVICLAVQADGKTIIGGSFSSVLGQPRNNIARLNTDDTLDAGFDPNVNSFVTSVAVQADGRILLGGSFTTVGGTTRDFIARVAANGTLEAGFNLNVDSDVLSVAVQADGRILLGGYFTRVGGTTRNYIARVAANGTLDAGFNPNPNNGVRSVAVQADGRILLGGQFTSVGGNGRNYIARVAANGTLDAGFNPNANNYVYSVAVQADGKVLLGGEFTTVGGTTRNRFARLLNDPATQSLTIPSASRVQWLRGGASPEVQPVTFELSTDGGTIYSALGAGTRISGGWERTGLTLPASGHIRARGRTTTTGGFDNSSSGLVEAVASFSLAVAPTVTAIAPPSGPTSGGTSVTLTGTNFTGATSVTFGGAAATSVTVVSATSITCVTPAGTAGTKSVVVTTAGGSNSANSLFTYVQVVTAQEGWRQQYFGSTANTGNGADTNDHDKDGLPNLLEWACNLHPTAPSTLPAAAVRNGASIEFTYHRSTSAVNAGAQMAVEWSDTLAAGSWSTTGVTQSILSDNGTVQQVMATIPAGNSGRRFVRLKVTQP